MSQEIDKGMMLVSKDEFFKYVVGIWKAQSIFSVH